MSENILILKQYNEAIMLDRDNDILLSYELTPSCQINYTTEGKLVEVCTEMANEIEGYFGIRVIDYGVVIRDLEYGA